MKEIKVITKSYRNDIQILRGMAVLAVVLYHSKESYFPLGYLGVDVFFVISGFVVLPLILRILSEQSIEGANQFDLKSFYFDRFWRLAPALATALIISWIMVFLFGPISDHERFSKQGIATLLLAGNLGAFKNAGDYFFPNPNALVHTWSLAVEVQIYILLPLVIVSIVRKRSNFIILTAAMLVFITSLSFISFLQSGIFQSLYSRVGIESASQFFFYSPIERIWQFTLGGLGFLLLNRPKSQIKKVSRNLRLILALILAGALFAPINLNFRLSSILVSFVTLTVILSRSMETIPSFIIKKLVWLGDRSYSIYLLHMPLLYIAKYSPAANLGNVENRVFQSITAVVATLVISAFSYQKIECRFRNLHKSAPLKSTSDLAVFLITYSSVLILFMAMHAGQKNDYLGLSRDISRPPYAGLVDPKCLRVSEMGPPCVYGNLNSSTSVLLIGDSHAGQISQAVIDAAKGLNLTVIVWAHGGCPVQFQRSPGGQVTDICIRVNKEMRSWLLANKPDGVIVSQFVTLKDYQIDLQSALYEIRSIVPKVLLVENIPVFPDGLTKRNKTMIELLGRFLIGSSQEPAKFVKLDEMQTRDRSASDKLASWARSNSISSINFKEIFCNNRFCIRFKGTDWLYIDDFHLSIAGARLTIPPLKLFLQSL